MNKRDLLECLLFAGLRLIAIVMLIVGAYGFLFQLIGSWYRFDPNYLIPFMLDTIFRPVLILIGGFALRTAAAGLARRTAARFTVE